MRLWTAKERPRIEMGSGHSVAHKQALLLCTHDVELRGRVSVRTLKNSSRRASPMPNIFAALHNEACAHVSSEDCLARTRASGRCSCDPWRSHRLEQRRAVGRIAGAAVNTQATMRGTLH